jgi:hypothetical protein
MFVRRLTIDRFRGLEFEDGTDLDHGLLAVLLARLERDALGPLDRLVEGLHLELPVAHDDLLRFRKWAVDDGSVATGPVGFALAFTLRGRCSERIRGRLPLPEALRDELGALLLAPAVQHLEV